MMAPTLTALRTNNFKEVIEQLYQLMRSRHQYYQELQNYLESGNGNITFGENVVSEILKLIQELPTKTTIVFLERLIQGQTTAEDMQAAVKWMEFFRQQTQPLDDILSNLKITDLDSNDGQTLSLLEIRRDIDNILNAVNSSQIQMPTPIQAVMTTPIRSHTQRNINEANMNFNTNNIDVFDISKETEDNIVKGFIEYLKNAKVTLQELDSRDISNSQIELLIDNWELTMHNLTLPSIADEGKRQQSIDNLLNTRSLLEENYNFLAEILQQKDPLGLQTR